MVGCWVPCGADVVSLCRHFVFGALDINPDSHKPNSLSRPQVARSRTINAFSPSDALRLTLPPCKRCWSTALKFTATHVTTGVIVMKAGVVSGPKPRREEVGRTRLLHEEVRFVVESLRKDDGLDKSTVAVKVWDAQMQKHVSFCFQA